jgi:signal transduction histidine kinase
MMISGSFNNYMKNYFDAEDGAYTAVTLAEIQKNTFNVKSVIRNLLERKLGKKNIPHAQDGGKQYIEFKICKKTNEDHLDTMHIPCKYSKPDRDEMSIYFSKGIIEEFDLRPDDIWYIYFQKGDSSPWLGILPRMTWNRLVNYGYVNTLTNDFTYIDKIDSDTLYVHNEKYYEINGDSSSSNLVIGGFRPSARLVCTIGEDIIKDMHAAIVEMVKNAYDADATKVLICLSSIENRSIHIQISDNGHGMSAEVVKDKWLVPSTSDKFIRKYSPKGRIMQGRKGIGRFAAAILGEELILETKSNGMKTHLSIDWNDFTEDKYLDEIIIDIDTTQTLEENGTTFNIWGSQEKLSQWNDSQIEYLIKELRKLLTPIDTTIVNNESDFEIIIQFGEFVSSDYQNKIIKIKPLPLIDYYDYRIFGKIYANGNSNLIYLNRNSGIEEEVTDFQYYLDERQKVSGVLTVDFRIFDRDPESIETLVYDLINAGDERLGKNEAKKMLNDIAGVSIFRNRFRIRPYGDEGNDWLSLDKKRVQNPAQKVGANQISGVIEIEDEDISNLVEKSARDGLKENAYYHGLVSIITQLLNYVELKRYSFRQKTGKGKKNHLFSTQFEVLTDYSAIKNKVISVMMDYNVSNRKVEEVNTFIEKDIDTKIKIAQELEKQIAMYQGQATLGKIMDVVMHEVRKPLSWIKNQSNNLESAYNRYLVTQNNQDINKVIKIIEETPNQLKIISNLFNRLNALSTRSRVTMVDFSINRTVEIALDIFKEEIERKAINVDYNPSQEITFKGWREDILSAIANILENAIYWVDFNKVNKCISVQLRESDNTIEISIWNNGPAIIRDLLNSNALFNPGISGKITKDGPGTGLGLAIAGEAIDRNGGVIKVLDVSEGAKFVVELSKNRGE